MAEFLDLQVRKKINTATTSSPCKTHTYTNTHQNHHFSRVMHGQVLLYTHILFRYILPTPAHRNRVIGTAIRSIDRPHDTFFRGVTLYGLLVS